jgi:predicted helicase
VDEILRAEFGQTLGSEGVHIIDPFVGTGTFITRLLQSGLITKEQLAQKYRHEIHANEIVLLAKRLSVLSAACRDSRKWLAGSPTKYDAGGNPA